MRLNDLRAQHKLRATTTGSEPRLRAVLGQASVFAFFVAALLLGACGVAQNSDTLEEQAAAPLEGQTIAADSEAARSLEPPAAPPAAGTMQRLAYIKMKQSSASARYAPKRWRDHIEASNPNQALLLEFRPTGVSLKRLENGASSDATSTLGSNAGANAESAIGMRWSGLGRGADITFLDAPNKPSIGAKEVRYEHRLDGAHHREWYLNGPLGLEQGFELTARPAGDTGSLVLEISFEGAKLSRAADGRSIELRGEVGRQRFRYSDLFALDANGNLLSSEMRIVENRVQLLIDDEGATYPLHIDPLLWQPDGLLSPLDQFDNDNEQLGRALSVSGDTVIVGAPNDSDFINEAGSAWVYRFDGADWLLEQTLTAPDAAAGDHFGGAVSVEGDLALVAAPDRDTGTADSGHVYVFARSGTQWSLVDSLSASDGAAGDRFGHAVQLRGGSAIIGAPQHDAVGAESGAAYVFVEDSGAWTEQAKLTAWDASVGARFGWAVDLSGDRAIVGAPNDIDAGVESGSAYLFSRATNTWSADTKLSAADASTGDRFGWAVSLTMDRAFVGAPEKDDGSLGADAGAAYVFVSGGWTQEQKLIPSEAGAMFGYSLSAAGNFVGVGAPLEETYGRVSLYERSGSNWTLNSYQSTTFSGSRLGHSVSLTNAYIAAGAPLDHRVGSASGSARVYRYDTNNFIVMDQLLSEPAHDSKELGSAVAVYGKYAAVGQNRTANGFAHAAGYVLIFKRENGSWQYQTTITHPVAINGTFGSALSMTNERLLIGNEGWSGGGDNHPGATVVFRRQNEDWVEEAVLPAPADASASGYGYAVALTNDRALVGDFVRRRAHVYLRNGQNWSEEDIITSPYPLQTTFFGRAVAMSEDTLLIGASVESTTHNNGGAAYVYARNGSNWSLQQRLAASDGDSNFYFGGSVSLSGDQALVGASRAHIQNAMNVTVDHAGAAYVFERSGTTWIQTDKLSASDGATAESFSTAVALQDSRIAIGASSSLTPSGGALYFFEKTGSSWTQTHKYSAPSGQNAINLGTSVGLDGGIAITGAPEYRFPTPSHRGAVYTFVASELGDPCNTDESCDSGFCADGVCCNNACGGSAADCQACSGDLTGGSDGTCTLALAGSLCRDAQGTCDAAEQCDGSSSECPADLLLPANTSCRPAASVCDFEEVCNGMLAACPPDAVAAAGGECRPAAGLCDNAELCNGTSGECPADTKAVAGSECRAAGGLCDVAEVCDGNSDDCPADDKAVAGTECRAAGGLCDVAEVCDGSSDDCPLDAVVSAGSECRAAAGVCDVAEQCDGSNGACPSDVKLGATSECRPAAGDCDQAEMCDGSADDCPADANAADGTLCDDGDRCTAPDSCQAGSCEGQNICGEGGMGGAGGSAQGGAGGAGGMGMGGMAGAGQGGAGDGGNSTGNGGNNNGADDVDSGCSCRAAAPPAKPQPMLWWAFGVGVILMRRRRKLQP